MFAVAIGLAASAPCAIAGIGTMHGLAALGMHQSLAALWGFASMSVAAPVSASIFSRFV